jgi:hypothetical protein
MTGHAQSAWLTLLGVAGFIIIPVVIIALIVFMVCLYTGYWPWRHW